MRSISISARRYDSDALLYDGFQKATGVPVNVIEGDGPELLARMKAQGKTSPADVFLTVDVGNLWLADKENLFQPAQSKTLDARIPALAQKHEESVVRFFHARAPDFVRLETSKSKAERDAAAKLTPIFPNQDDRGPG